MSARAIPKAGRRAAAGLALVAASALAPLACAELNLVEPGGAAEMRVSPDTVILRIGDSTILRAAPLDASRTLLAHLEPEWATASAAVATVDQHGLVRATGAGVVTLSAVIGAVGDSAIAIVSGDPASIASSSGNGTTAGVNEVVVPVVRVTDAQGNGVYRVPVTFAVTGGGGSVLTPQPALTDIGGYAQAQWRLGPLPGPNALTVTPLEPLAGSPVAFTATAEVGPPDAAASTVEASPASIAPSAGNVTSTITVTVRDALGRTVAGAAVSLTATGTGNTLTQPGTVTDNAGQVSGTLSSTVAGPKVVSALVNGVVAVAQQATIEVNADAPAAIAVITQPGGAVSNAQFLTQPVIEVRDAFGNRLLNATDAVTVTLLAGDGVLASATGSFVANAVAGRASFTGLHVRGLRPAGDTLGIGAHRLRFAIPGLPAVDSDEFNVDVSFAYNVVDVFNRSCGGTCHNYSTIALIETAPLIGPCVGQVRVVPGDSTSLMYTKVKSPATCGSPMPFGPPISSRVRAIIRDWILQGARDN
jgi:hypothetical protein